MGRILRKVPANWQHPKKDDGKYQPMFDEFYLDALNEWLEDHNKWENGTHQRLIDGSATKLEYPFYAMYGGDPPDIKYYQTKKYSPEELTHIQLYEDTSEGTPLSPIFRADELEALCSWAEQNATTFASFKATKEEWMSMLSGGFVFHRVGNAIFI